MPRPVLTKAELKEADKNPGKLRELVEKHQAFLHDRISMNDKEWQLRQAKIKKDQPGWQPTPKNKRKTGPSLKNPKAGAGPGTLVER